MKLARTGLSPSAGGLSRPFRFASRSRVAVLQPRRRRNAAGLGFSPFARHYWGNHSCFLFLQVLRCFSSLRSPHHKVMPCLQHGGLSHSEIPASTAICASTGLIAACHVLRRLREPRHPPCALSILPVVSPLILHATASRKGTGQRRRSGGSIYIRLFDFCSTLNFSACINMSMNESLPKARGLPSRPAGEPTPCGPMAFRIHGEAARGRERVSDGPTSPKGRTTFVTTPERRCSSRTFRYGYLVTT